MNKIKIKYITIGFVLGLSCCSIATYAASYINSKQITYSNSSSTVTSVSGALDELYQKESESIYNKIDWSVTKSYSQGNQTAGRTSSITLSKGNYIVQFSAGHNWISDTARNDYRDSLNKEVVFSPGSATCTALTNQFWVTSGTSVAISNYYTAFINYNYIYKCSTTDTTTLSFANSSTNLSSDNKYGDFVQIEAIKID